MTARRKFAEIPTAELFAMVREPKKRNGGETSKRMRPVGRARCPECVSHKHTGVLMSGSHLVYAEHTYPTYSGARMTCRASGVALCQLPPRPWPAAPDSAVLTCPHGPRKDSGATTSN